MLNRTSLFATLFFSALLLAWPAVAHAADAPPLKASAAYDRAIPIKSGIKNQQITDAWLERIAGLPDLRSLDVSITVIKGPGLKHIATLKNLESLNLTLTLVTDPYLGQLRDLGKMKVFL